MTLRVQTKHLTVDFVGAAIALMNPGKGATVEQCKAVIELLDCEADTFHRDDILSAMDDAYHHLFKGVKP